MTLVKGFHGWLQVLPGFCGVCRACVSMGLNLELRSTPVELLGTVGTQKERFLLPVPVSHVCQIVMRRVRLASGDDTALGKQPTEAAAKSLLAGNTHMSLFMTYDILYEYIFMKLLQFAMLAKAC